MLRNPYYSVLSISFAFIFMVAPLLAATADDQRGEEGIMVRNATMIDLWYKKNDGECLIWIHEHLFTIKPGNNIKLYSDLNCQTLYCTNNPTYKDYRSIDSSGDYRVKILPNCTLSDM